MIIYGGTNNFNNKIRMRTCFNDIFLFDLKEYTWKTLLQKGDIIGSRRHHAAALVSWHHLAIYGGINP